MKRVSQFIVLCEDQRQQSLVRHYLYNLGYTARDIRFEPQPSGTACGEQWVRRRYAEAVRLYRQRTHRSKTALIVVIDADTMKVNARAEQLREQLDRMGMSDRVAGERIAHLIPKRNVETWVLCLGGSEVDEETNYKRTLAIDDRVRRASSQLFEWSRRNFELRSWCVPSLAAAIPELRRLESE